MFSTHIQTDTLEISVFLKPVAGPVHSVSFVQNNSPKSFGSLLFCGCHVMAQLQIRLLAGTGSDSTRLSQNPPLFLGSHTAT